MMKRYCMPVLLVLSVLLNVGVIAAVVVRSADGLFTEHNVQQGHTFLADYLQLDERQLPLWRSNEHRFLTELNQSWSQITEHRERMIREIFSDTPEMAVIEAQRQAIARLQAQQQHAVIEQMLKEREILSPAQRRTLADLLINHYPLGSLEQMLVEEVNHD